MSKKFEALRAKAINGSTPAQIELGHWYLTGKTFDGNRFLQDFDQARYWFERAHERGSSTATVLLGVMCEEGKGGDADVSCAIKYYEAAAKRDAYLPCLYLARIYALGKGVPVSEEQAKIWYERVLSYEGQVEGGEEMEEARKYLRSIAR